MLNHILLKVENLVPSGNLDFVSLLNHNITKGQNSLYMIFKDSGRVQ